MKKKLTKAFLSAILFALIGATPSFSADFFPVGDGYSWTYKGFMKDNPKKDLVVKATVVRREMIDGKEYYYYSAPNVDVRFMVRTDENFGYMKIVKYPFPILKFLTVDVYLTPEIKFIKFPYKVGDKWEQTINAKAALPPFGLDMKLKVNFEVMDSEKITLKGKEYEVFHVRMYRDEGRKEPHIEDNWFAEGLGFVRGETSEYFIELKDFETGK